jgi:DNA-directed RNA polymerase specialized sigma subunit
VADKRAENAKNQIDQLERDLTTLRSLMKKGNRLTDVGRSVVRNLILKNISQTEIARMLGITPAAVAYYKVKW